MRRLLLFGVVFVGAFALLARAPWPTRAGLVLATIALGACWLGLTFLRCVWHLIRPGGSHRYTSRDLDG